ncbi:hypothetical protein [Metabacillus fastidiosus]|uniref:hypothetical protein n=1 Tax=Metabacillus fastidiosus TaxID=1458 RepID=UPI003D2691A2
MNYQEHWEKTYEKRDELNSLFSTYWDQYSSLGNWQFWMVLFLFIFPLILLYFKIDRTRVFEILFFGDTVHLIWAYIDIALGRSGYFVFNTYFPEYLQYDCFCTGSQLFTALSILYKS